MTPGPLPQTSRDSMTIRIPPVPEQQYGNSVSAAVSGLELMRAMQTAREAYPGATVRAVDGHTILVTFIDIAQTAPPPLPRRLLGYARISGAAEPEEAGNRKTRRKGKALARRAKKAGR